MEMKIGILLNFSLLPSWKVRALHYYYTIIASRLFANSGDIVLKFMSVRASVKLADTVQYQTVCYEQKSGLYVKGQRVTADV